MNDYASTSSNINLELDEVISVLNSVVYLNFIPTKIKHKYDTADLTVQLFPTLIALPCEHML